MNVPAVSNTPFYTKKQLKNEVKTAAVSAGISAGLTLAINRGKDIKRAGYVAAIAATASFAIGAVQRLINMAQNKNKEKTASVETHQG